ncbi:uncharacterized protein LOC128321943 isoform X1 [Hemicordylus capensis]|uniref:uncharacterized protein LOC128321943 isoform X1 n=1 Tax=Hemicordylus capensis TaxID=884348 RepID=UPI0023043069|nr:uncharacterized protein LOC128321943 isoform X1 [Hemicordylus capensis]XP_053098488.1 uncharacterized protein LOC128321943 isoform X1 [Hemicordylus capensis]XP_053098489.1 uncharacterized protein LOC128321943 isoform X1 [Hemicordylus capensis]
MSSSAYTESDEFDEDLMSASSMGEEEAAALMRDLEQSVSFSIGILPEGLSEEKLVIELASVLLGLTSEDPEIKLKALQNFFRNLTGVKADTTAQLPDELTGRLVAMTCLCALEDNKEIRQMAAEDLCELLPILRRGEQRLMYTPWGKDMVKRALSVLGPTTEPNPSFFSGNCYNLAMVFSAFLSSEQLLEVMHFLGGDLTTEGSFDLANIFHLLREFIKQFSSKSMWLEELMDQLFIRLKDRVPHGQDVALLAFPILAVDHLEEVVLYLLKHPFSKCQEYWQAIFNAADHSQILVEVAKWMPECSRVATRAVRVLNLFLKSNDKQAMKERFPHLLLALLQHIYARLEENLGVIESLETLYLLLRTVGIEEESLGEYLEHFGRPEGFSYGLSILVSILIAKGSWSTPALAHYIGALFEGKQKTRLLEIALDIYLELFINQHIVEANQETVDFIFNCLGHDNAQVRKLSLQGIALLLNSEVDPWTISVALLSSLGMACKPDVIPELMMLVEIALHSVSGERGEAYMRKLASVYCGYIAHEKAMVRAAAIEHLGMLRARFGEQWPPCIPEEGLYELVNVLIHLEDEDEVAEATKATLKQLVPEVRWRVDPKTYSLHRVLHQAAKYVTKKYKKDLVRGAAFSCMLPSSNNLPAVSRVAALFVGHLAHKNATFITLEDMGSYCTWLEGMAEHNDEEVRRAGESTICVMQKAVNDHTKGRVHTLKKRFIRHVKKERCPKDFKHSVPARKSSKSSSKAVKSKAVRVISEEDGSGVDHAVTTVATTTITTSTTSQPSSTTRQPSTTTTTKQASTTVTRKQPSTTTTVKKPSTTTRQSSTMTTIKQTPTTTKAVATPSMTAMQLPSTAVTTSASTMTTTRLPSTMTTTREPSTTANQPDTERTTKGNKSIESTSLKTILSKPLLPNPKK